MKSAKRKCAPKTKHSTALDLHLNIGQKQGLNLSYLAELVESSCKQGGKTTLYLSTLKSPEPKSSKMVLKRRD